jgi:SAM-dependent methyltransferase
VEFAVAGAGLEPRHRVLDLCSGAGRHLAALRSRGFAPVGLDLSLVLLRAARAASPAAPLIRADMRRLPLADASFDAVLSFFTSFGYFPDDHENQGVVREVGRVLRPGGRFLLDFLHRDHVLAHGVRDTAEIRDGRVVEQTRRRNRERDSVDKRIKIYPEGRPEAARVYRESVRLYAPDRVAAFLDEAGIDVNERFGSFAGDRFTERSERLILVGTRRHPDRPMKRH